ncbi:MAG: hypothetical protein LBS99_01795, partial [Clostridiales bacterium]|nr:hypothetical protein [Clostridiales bacterium]
SAVITAAAAGETPFGAATGYKVSFDSASATNWYDIGIGIAQTDDAAFAANKHYIINFDVKVLESTGTALFLNANIGGGAKSRGFMLPAAGNQIHVSLSFITVGATNVLELFGNNVNLTIVIGNIRMYAYDLSAATAMDITVDGITEAGKFTFVNNSADTSYAFDTDGNFVFSIYGNGYPNINTAIEVADGHYTLTLDVTFINITDANTFYLRIGSSDRRALKPSDFVTSDTKTVTYDVTVSSGTPIAFRIFLPDNTPLTAVSGIISNVTLTTVAG